MDQREITDDLMELIQEGLLVNGRQAQIERVAGGGNQLAFLEEDGSGAIITVRGPMSSAMKEGGARSMTASHSSVMDTMERKEEERKKASDEWSGQDGDDG